MKKLLLTVLLISLFVFACDEKEEEFSLDLTGSWVTLSLNDTVISNNNQRSTEIKNEIYSRSFADTYTFHPDGKLDFKSLNKGTKQGKYYFANRRLHIQLANEEVVSYEVGLSYAMVLIASRQIHNGFGNLQAILPSSMTNDPELEISKINIRRYIFKIGAPGDRLNKRPNIPNIPTWDKVPDVVEVYKELSKDRP